MSTERLTEKKREREKSVCVCERERERERERLFKREVRICRQIRKSRTHG